MKSSLPIAVIVIPTYNEAGSIGKIIEYLFTKTFPNIKNWQMKILVVDDTSPDKTYEIVQKLQKTYPKLSLLINPDKQGIGAAYLKGFKYAMEKLQADAVFEMDGDFQHPPELIPVMLAKLDAGYDYVIGSRKIPGGSNPKGWGFKRVFLSEFGSLIARFVLFFPFKNFLKVTDPTTGFKVTRVKGFVDNLNLNPSHLYTKSFGYKFQLLFETLLLGAKYAEVPLVFNVRTSGESKIESQATLEMLVTTFKIRWHDPFIQKFLKFGIVGFIGFIINFVGFRLLKVTFKNLPIDISLINWISNALAAECAIISNFIWNNLWTFSADKITSAKTLLSKFVTFNFSSLITGIIIPSTFVSICTHLFGDQWSSVYLVIGIFGLTIPLNWFVYNKFIWKKK